MNILLSNDHAGTELKKEVKEFLENKGYKVNNLGEDLGESVDYPDFIHPLAKEISNKNEEKELLFVDLEMELVWLQINMKGLELHYVGTRK